MADSHTEHVEQRAFIEPSSFDHNAENWPQGTSQPLHAQTLSETPIIQSPTQNVHTETAVNQEGSSDADQQRRKRRKLTPTTETTTDQASRTSNGGALTRTSQITIDWMIKPKQSEGTDPIVKVGDGKSEANIALSSSTGDAIHDSGSASHRAMSTSRPQGSNNVGEESISATKRRIPKRKTLSLHGSKGLLIPSTDTTTARPNPAFLDPEPDVRLKKKVTMRNGHLVPSLVVVLTYNAGEKCKKFGERIDQILSQPPSQVYTKSKTHPFFTHKPSTAIAKVSSDQRSDSLPPRINNEQGTSRSSVSNPSVAWKDLKFSKPAALKTVDTFQAIWPPRELQSIGREYCDSFSDILTKPTSKNAKKKAKVIDLRETENVLHVFAQGLAGKHENDVYTPTRAMLTGWDLAQALDEKAGGDIVCKALNDLKSEIITGSTAFDRGEAASQQLWATKYAPKNSDSVLQPCSGILHRWLQSLAVHNIKSGPESNQAKTKEKLVRRRKKQKRISDSMDDFIVDSDCEDSTDHTIQNAILIVGPSGCGKTASVYAAAKELGFEVFEIHPGMRRSAKDIFDRVGDMTQNHLVRHAEEAIRGSSVAPTEPSLATTQGSDAHQKSMNAFFGGSEKERVSRPTKAAASKKEQKQSLILFEEVDILFEEDKAFWLGVQSLILQSRRPVVMTCNNVASVPLNELNLHTVLEYEAQNNILATEYLTFLAAAEGHIIERKALSTLYESKGSDLRASIMELNYWCQMTVGSKQGGLDWIPDATRGKHPVTATAGNSFKTCSLNTFRTGLDMMPQTCSVPEEMLQYSQDQLSLPAIDWFGDVNSSRVNEQCGHQDSIHQLNAALSIREACSVLDLVDDTVSPYLASYILALTPGWDMDKIRMGIPSIIMRNRNASSSSLKDVSEALGSLQEDKTLFPPGHGRLAPTLDTLRFSIVTDVAPYVRSIVAYEKRSEQQREELFGSQGKKTRLTRAAMAAAEGGDKAYTRAERWFPATLDWGKVLLTGNEWPQWACNTSEGTEFTNSDAF